MAWTSEPVAVPSIRWIGVHPTDFEYLDTDEQLISLSRVDRIKLNSLIQRPYMEHCPELLEQLQIMQSDGLKAEIQIFPDCCNFFRDKIMAEEWIWTNWLARKYVRTRTKLLLQIVEFVQQDNYKTVQV